MDTQSSLVKSKGSYGVRAALFGIIAVLFQVAPHQLGLVFMLGAVGNLYRVERIRNDPDRSAVAKGVFFAEWIACWLLAFGFKFQLLDLTVTGIALVLLANVIEQVGERLHLSDRLFNVAWLAMFLYMLVKVVLDPNWLAKAL